MHSELVLTLLVAFALPTSGCGPVVADSAKKPVGESASKKKEKKDPPRPLIVCARVLELVDEDMKGRKGEEKKIMEAMKKGFQESCVEAVSKQRDEDPDAYAKAADCVMGASNLDAAMKCDFSTVKPKQKAGKACGFFGTYMGKRARSTNAPGSCGSNYPFETAVPLRISADSNATSGYRVEVGYADPAGAITYTACKNSVQRDSCSVFATCERSADLDEITFEICGDEIRGTIERSAAEKCTVNFILGGSRT